MDGDLQPHLKYIFIGVCLVGVCHGSSFQNKNTVLKCARWRERERREERGGRSVKKK